MRIKVYLIELSPRGKRSLVLGAALAIVAATALPADANVPNQFTTGEVLSASQMNANFADIDAWRGHPVVTHGGKQWSLGAAYCGLTAPTTGNIGGYAATKTQCEAACSSPSAHMCTADEIVRSLQMGVGVGPGGWFSAGLRTSTSGGTTDDCNGGSGNGWTSNGSDYGPVMSNNGAVALGPCSSSASVLCCD